MKNSGKHVFGKFPADLLAELRGSYFLFGLVKEGDLFLGKVVNDTAVPHQLQLVDDDMLYLTEFSPVPHVLDEGVLPALKHNFPQIIHIHDVSCPVDGLRIRMVQRILDEGGGCLFRIIIIAHCQRGATNTKLPFLVGFDHLPVVFIQDQDIGIPARIPYGDRLLIPYLSFNDVIGAIQRDFNGAVQIGE